MCCIIVNSYLVRNKDSKGLQLAHLKLNKLPLDLQATVQKVHFQSLGLETTYFRQIPSSCGTWTCHKGNRNPLSEWSRLRRVLHLFPRSTRLCLNIIQNKQLNVITLTVNNSSASQFKQTTQNRKLFGGIKTPGNLVIFQSILLKTYWHRFLFYKNL